jgi:hypothetical protein
LAGKQNAEQAQEYGQEIVHRITPYCFITLLSCSVEIAIILNA